MSHRIPSLAAMLGAAALVACTGCGMLPGARTTVQTTVAPQATAPATTAPATTVAPATTTAPPTVTTSAPPPATVTVTQQTTVAAPPPTQAPATTQAPPPQTQAPAANYVRRGTCGATAEVPSTLAANQGGGYGDGGGGVMFVCSAGNGSIDQALAAKRASYAQAGSNITAAQVVDGEQFLISGYTSDGKIFYDRAIYRAGRLYEMIWNYRSDHREFDDYVEHSVSTFRVG